MAGELVSFGGSPIGPIPVGLAPLCQLCSFAVKSSSSTTSVKQDEKASSKSAPDTSGDCGGGLRRRSNTYLAFAQLAGARARAPRVEEASHSLNLLGLDGAPRLREVGTPPQAGPRQLPII